MCSDFPNQMSIARVRIFGNACEFGFSYPVVMARNVDFDWHLTDWMRDLEVTQADLCRATGFPKAKMSELVTGKSRYNRDIVNVLSRALNIQHYELLMHPAEAFALRRLRESAIRIAAENLPEAGETGAARTDVRKNRKKVS
jgi:plasmid maintenance system antidote protein VapI